MERFLDTEDICKALNISRTTLFRYRKDGMPYIQIKRKLMFDVEAVIKWVSLYKK